jgi:anti-anti-sigma factor
VSKQKIELTLPADLKFSALVRRISEEVFHHVGFTKEWANRLKLVVDELFMNANRYGSEVEDDKIFILYTFDKEEVSFRIEDEGKGKRKTNAAELKKVINKNTDEVSDLTKTSGRGLALISSLWTDDMTIEDSERGGIAISFKKKIDAGAPPASPPMKPVDKESVTPSAPQGTKEEIKIAGEIDASNLEKKIQPISDKIKALSPGSTLVLDCEELAYINSTFIGHLAAWLNELQAKQGHMILKNTNKQIREVLELVGLNKVIYFES